MSTRSRAQPWFAAHRYERAREEYYQTMEQRRCDQQLFEFNGMMVVIVPIFCSAPGYSARFFIDEKPS